MISEVTFRGGMIAQTQQPATAIQPLFSGAQNGDRVQFGMNINGSVDELNQAVRTEKGRSQFTRTVKQKLNKQLSDENKSKIYSFEMNQMLIPLEIGRRAIGATFSFTSKANHDAVMKDLVQRGVLTDGVRGPYADTKKGYYDFTLANGLVVKVETEVISKLECQQRELWQKLWARFQDELNGMSKDEDANQITLYIAPGKIQKVADALVQENILTREPDGSYKYESANVTFKEMGRAVAL